VVALDLSCAGVTPTIPSLHEPLRLDNAGRGLTMRNHLYNRFVI
jgi:hypothetical protein